MRFIWSLSFFKIAIRFKPVFRRLGTLFMDVASSFAVSVAPPPFQKEVEEARRDTQNRVSIPKAQQSEGSAAQSQVADRRGSTQGENSLLNAQQMGIMDAQDELTILPDGRRKRNRKQKDNGEESSSEKEEQSKGDGKFQQFKDESTDNDKAHLAKQTVKSGFDPVTGYYEIPATKRHKRRSILLVFREQNVHFLEQFSDKSTAVGLINFALTRRYGSIIPHCRRGQVVERQA